MKKLTVLFALLTLSVGLWAETAKVSYVYPVYNTEGDPKSGIKEWKTGSINNAIVVEDAPDGPYAVNWNAGWYVVTGKDVKIESGAICNGDVKLILANGAKLTVESSSAGIRVSGDDNSLTIYAQSTDPATMGQLIVTSTGAAGIGGESSVTGNGGDGSNITINGGIVNATGKSGAGIGGGSSNSSYVGGKGSNITINGGIVTATGNAGGSAGIGGATDGGSGSDITINGGTVTANGGNIGGAGIGGGYGEGSSGSNITINGGKVTANGGYGGGGAGIGGGKQGSGSNITITGGEVTANGGDHGSGIGAGNVASNYSNITVATTHIVTADGNEITNNGGDLASILKGKKYVKIEVNLKLFRDDAIAAINDAINGVTDEGILAIADKAKEDINKATTREDIDAIKDKALTDISLFPQKDAAITEITTAREGIQNTNLNNWIDGAINDIKNGGPDATPGIDEIKTQILTIINFFKDGKAEGDVTGYARGLEEGKAAAKAELPTDPEGTAGHTVTITKGEKTLILVNPDKVTYGKQE